MNTTVTIVEILVVGLFGCAWLSLAAMRAAGIEWSLVADSLQRWQHWSTAATAIGTLVSYQFGWLINGLSRRLMWGFEKSERDLVLVGRNNTISLARLSFKIARRASMTTWRWSSR